METAGPSTTGYERRKNRKRAQILAAAEELFKQGGFSRVSVAQIARLAGVSPVTIYNHFGDKYHLVEAVVSAVVEAKVEEYRRILTSDDPWPQRLRAVILDKRKTLREFDGELLQALYREFPDLVQRVRELRPRVQQTIMYPFLEEGRRLGHVPEGASNDAVAAYLEVIARGFDGSPEILRRIASEPELFDQILDLVIRGLASNRR